MLHFLRTEKLLLRCWLIKEGLSSLRYGLHRFCGFWKLVQCCDGFYHWDEIAVFTLNFDWQYVPIGEQHSPALASDWAQWHIGKLLKVLLSGLVFPSNSVNWLLWETTILVKTVGTICAFPPPPITMLIFHGLQNQDPFIDRWHVSTLSGGRGRERQAVKEEHTLLI